MASASTSVFVGRQTELRILRDAYREASGGDSQVVLVEGEAGIGKTTLVERLLSELPHADTLSASIAGRRLPTMRMFPGGSVQALAADVQTEALPDRTRCLRRIATTSAGAST